MALSMETIIFNFRKASEQADELDEIADKLSKMASSDYAETMQNISVNWKGENASAYLGKGKRLQGNITSTAKKLHSIASEIRCTAKRIYEAEMRALAIVEKRIY